LHHNHVPDRSPTIPFDRESTNTYRIEQRRPGPGSLPFDGGLPDQDIQALRQLADEGLDHLRSTGQSTDQANVGIYRQFGRSSRVAARILGSLLRPATCHILTAASDRQVDAGRTRPVQLDLVLDVSRLAHPIAQRVAERAGVPLLTRPFPTMAGTGDGGDDNAAVREGTSVGRVVAVGLGTRSQRRRQLTEPPIRSSTGRR
jgi:hypothetical protein